MDEFEAKVIQDVDEYGCHIIHVMEEDNLPSFSYSIGITKNYKKPELCVFGLKRPIAHFIINEYQQRILKGERFETEKFYPEFIEGFDVCFEPVALKHYKEHFGWALWYNKDLKFDVWQLIYPTTSGIYPWSNDATEDFLKYQPILTENGKTRFHK